MQQEQPEDEKRETHNGKTRDGPYHINRWYDPSRDIIVSVIVLYISHAGIHRQADITYSP